MPTVSLTAQQQATVDAANKVLADAQATHDGALANYNAARANFCGNWWNYLTNCDIRKADSRALNQALAVAATTPAGVIANIIHNWTQKSWAKPTSCQEAIDKGVLISWECHRGSSPCISKEGCNDRIADYNRELNKVYGTASALDGAKGTLSSAKDNLAVVLDAIAKDPTVQGNVDIINKGIDAQKQKDMIKWAFFGLAAVLIVGGAIYIGTRMLKGGSATT